MTISAQPPEKVKLVLRVDHSFALLVSITSHDRSKAEPGPGFKPFQAIRGNLCASQNMIWTVHLSESSANMDS